MAPVELRVEGAEVPFSFVAVTIPLITASIARLYGADLNTLIGIVHVRPKLSAELQ